MQLQMLQLVNNMPRSNDVNLVDFIYNLVFKASVSGLYTVELSESIKFYNSFFEFDKVFSLTLAGIPIQYLTKGKNGRDYCRDILANIGSTNNCKLINHRNEVYLEHGVRDNDRGGIPQYIIFIYLFQILI